MFTFKIEPDNGDPYEITAKSRDIVRWEKRFKGRNLAQVQRDYSMAALTELAYVAAVRQGKFEGDFATFETEHDLDLSGDDDDDEAGPIRLDR